MRSIRIIDFSANERARILHDWKRLSAVQSKSKAEGPQSAAKENNRRAKASRDIVRDPHRLTSHEWARAKETKVTRAACLYPHSQTAHVRARAQQSNDKRAACLHPAGKRTQTSLAAVCHDNMNEKKYQCAENNKGKWLRNKYATIVCVSVSK